MTGQEGLIYSPSGDCSAFWEEKAAESRRIQHTVMSVFINRGLALLPSAAAGCGLGGKAGGVPSSEPHCWEGCLQRWARSCMERFCGVSPTVPLPALFIQLDLRAK